MSFKESIFLGIWNTCYIGVSTGIDWLTSGSDGMFMDSMPVGVGETSVGGIAMQSFSTIADSSDGGPDFVGKIGDIEFKGWFKDSVPYERVEKKACNVYEAFSQHKIAPQKTVYVAENQHAYTILKKLLVDENGMINYTTLVALEKVLMGDE